MSRRSFNHCLRAGIFLIILMASLSLRPATVRAAGTTYSEDATFYTITRRNSQNQITYHMKIRKSDFGYSFLKSDGVTPYAASRAETPDSMGTGICYSPPNSTTVYNVNRTWFSEDLGNVITFRVQNTNNNWATISIELFDWYTRVIIDPDGAFTDSHTICAQTGPMEPVYGLGDYGGYPLGFPDAPYSSVNSADKKHLCDGDFRNRTTNHRFISNFAIFPAQEFAEVLFFDGSKTVCTNTVRNLLGANGIVNQVGNLYYFMGDIPGIYANYKTVRNSHGYLDAKAHARIFEVGFESWGALSWNTHQSGVQAALDAYTNPNTAQYPQAGYRLRWGVIGSGFWKGNRINSPSYCPGTNILLHIQSCEQRQGNTNSFGMWDTTAEPNRTDNLPNPRYPNVDGTAGLKAFFNERNLKLIIGMRLDFAATERTGLPGEQVPADGEGNGFYNQEHHGTYPLDGRANNYFLTNPGTTTPTRFNVNFPAGDVWMLDSSKPAARDWFVQGVNMWGVGGFKEDTMMEDTFVGDHYTTAQPHSDAYVNDLNERVVAEAGKDYLVMVRNSAYSVPGDVLRQDDANFAGGAKHTNKDRVPINMLSFAASGAPNVYADTVGGDGTRILNTTAPLVNKKTYMLRHALLSAVTPVMAMGLNPAAVDSGDIGFQNRIKAAAIWHAKFAPYIHSAAVDSYTTGYPFTMTPLPIAFPSDANTYKLADTTNRQYQWMLGPSMMAFPIYGEDAVPITGAVTMTSRNLYLPAGRWVDFSTGAEYQGPMTIQAYPHPLDSNRIPIMIGGKGTVVFRTAEANGQVTSEGNTGLVARIYPIKSDGSSYTFTYPDGSSTSQITNSFVTNSTGLGGIPWKCATLTVTDTTTNANVAKACSETGNRYVQFSITPGHNYTLTGGQ